MKRFCVLAILLVMVIVIPKSVFANTYTNNNGVTMTQEQYSNLLKIYSEKYISVMDQDKFDQVMSMNLDYNNVQEKIMYIKTDYNHMTDQVSSTEISKEEYDAASENNNSRAAVFETSYKRISLYLSQTDTNYAFFTFSALWKIMPAVRSFDVIGVRLSRLRVVNATQGGRQIYDLNGVTDYVQYNWNGTNISNQSLGYGISMNLVNSNITYLECTTDATMILEAYPAGLFASYQHAVDDITLATSKNYTIGPLGLGDVFEFASGVGTHYDGMQGVYEYLSSAS